jgi:hypothetical protein
LRWNFVGIKTSLARDIAIDVWVKCVSRGVSTLRHVNNAHR